MGIWGRHRARRCVAIAVAMVAFVGLLLDLSLVTASAKPSQQPSAPVWAPRPYPGPGRGSHGATAPSPGRAPSALTSGVKRRVLGTRKPTRAHKPAPALLPAHGTVLSAPATPSSARGKSRVDGIVHFGAPHAGSGRLIIPPPSAAHPSHASGFSPSAFYSSTQLDNFSQVCGFGVNETSIAQSSANPNLLVAGANTYYDKSGNCQDSHAGVVSTPPTAASIGISR